jgi:hypothetical protein
MSYSTQGASNRQVYDCCKYAQDLKQSVDPLQYNLYFGAQENCSKCIDKKAWFKQDTEIVNVESELWNITRPLSDCDQYKYNPDCQTSDSCISTFSPNVPRILSPSLCPIVYNNIPIQDSPGYTVPNPNICGNTWREASAVNTFKDYENNVKNILGNSKQPEDIYMFLNNCNQQPLYNGAMENVQPYFSNTYNSALVNDQSRMSIGMEQNMNRQEMNQQNNMTDDDMNNFRRLSRNQ